MGGRCKAEIDAKVYPGNQRQCFIKDFIFTKCFVEYKTFCEIKLLNKTVVFQISVTGITITVLY